MEKTSTSTRKRCTIFCNQHNGKLVGSQALTPSQMPSPESFNKSILNPTIFMLTLTKKSKIGHNIVKAPLPQDGEPCLTQTFVTFARAMSSVWTRPLFALKVKMFVSRMLQLVQLMAPWSTNLTKLWELRVRPSMRLRTSSTRLLLDIQTLTKKSKQSSTSLMVTKTDTSVCKILDCTSGHRTCKTTDERMSPLKGTPRNSYLILH